MPVSKVPEIVTTQIPLNPIEPVTGDDQDYVTVNGGAAGTAVGFGWLLENAHLRTDMDCDSMLLLNVREVVPVPPPLIDTDDPRLSDSRNMLDGSVYDKSVADDAAIEQSKLNLNGFIPPNYLVAPDSIVTTGAPSNPLEEVDGDDGNAVTVGGITQVRDELVFDGVTSQPVTGDDGQPVTVSDPSSRLLSQYAASGLLVERVANKGQDGGYCPLDSSGHIPPQFIPAGGLGSVTFIGLSFPPEFTSSPPSGNNGDIVFGALFEAAPAQSWFGTAPTGSDAPGQALTPRFHTAPVAVALIPNLDASVIGSGVFNLSRMPYAHMGVFTPGPPVIGSAPSSTSSAGILPDPGAIGDPTDYLARDMSYKKMAPPPSYEPPVPDPSIVNQGGGRIAITSQLAGVSLFYRINFTGLFHPIPPLPFYVDPGLTVEAYGAKQGYINSNIVTLTVPPRPSGT